MTLSREQMLIEMGISPIWVLREPGQTVVTAASEEAPERSISSADPDVPQMPAAQPIAEAPRVPVSPTAISGMDWPTLSKQVAECRLCPLCQQRKQAVLGVGDLNPDWLFIGEGRGNRVYIANAVKCRPPGNRTPESAEMAACWSYLERQIALLKPKIIVLLGKAAVHAVLHDDKTLGAMRGQRFEYAGIPVVVTYHPAYLLRNLPDKAKAWEDLLFARRLLGEQTTPELPF